MVIYNCEIKESSLFFRYRPLTEYSFPNHSQNEVSGLRGHSMPNPDKLSTSTGQLGPKCAKTGKPLKFSEAIVHDGEYLSYEAYLELTGAEPSTEPKTVPGLRME